MRKRALVTGVVTSLLAAGAFGLLSQGGEPASSGTKRLTCSGPQGTADFHWVGPAFASPDDVISKYLPKGGKVQKVPPPGFSTMDSGMDLLYAPDKDGNYRKLVRIALRHDGWVPTMEGYC